MAYKIVVMVGTRPEVIKMAPVVRELERRSGTFEPLLVTTAQHRDLLDQTLASFALDTCADLALMTRDQRLPAFTGRAVPAVADLLGELAPDAVLIHGDTTTAFATALAAFYKGLLIGHVEAGLRSNQRESPFPEEMNRRLIGNLAELHFAPTARARANLLREGVDDDTIYVTGNTVVDALHEFRPDSAFDDSRLESLVGHGEGRLLVVTAHRRETLGAPLEAICQALRDITRRFSDTRIVFPVHPNPRVRDVVCRELSENSAIALIEPVGYADFLRLVHRSCLILTDSGGLQEEAPSLGKPVLVLRDTTERPELLEAGGGLLVGTDPRRIVRAAARLLRNRAAYDRMAAAPNPFGDGRAASRIVDVLERRLGASAQIEEPDSLALAAS
jgi:UDP-N-acetylglucosamine 2-epimerase (non-hydrolysing)